MTDEARDAKALNLARIVFRLLTNPRGWRVDALRESLGIKPRTLRKYLQDLRLHFPEFMDDHGRSLLTITREGDDRAAVLRLADDAESLDKRPTFIWRAMVLELARQAFRFLENTDLGADVAAFHDEHHGRIAARTEAYKGVLRYLDRKLLVVPWAPKSYSKHSDRVRTLVNAIIDQRTLRVRYDSNRHREGFLVDPLTLVVWQTGLFVFVREASTRKHLALAVDRIHSVELTSKSFHYPKDYAFQTFSNKNF